MHCTLVTNDVFEEELTRFYQTYGEDTSQIVEDIHASIDLGRLIDAVPESEDLLEQQDDAPIIRLINALLMKALENRASDIHIEIYEKHISIRFRIDGILQEVLRPKRSLAQMLISRIKVMAKLNIAEKRLPQDGHITLRIAGREVDVRVSTIPTSSSERVVLRLLDKKSQMVSLEELGMSEQAHRTMQDILREPHGVVLVTGPTGSGKTTTLYAALQSLNDGRRNILTVEDPIEYTLAGVGQTPVNRKVDMTFARGLRAILRQDPDVVMVGEIRDEETARIAMQASLTGHLVFSTLHTNSAVGAVTRLLDIGIESYLIASSLAGLIAQRLVRKLCEHCKVPVVVGRVDCDFFMLDYENPPLLYRAQGCPHCKGTGYEGRVGIFQVIEIDHHLREMIHNVASEQSIEAYVSHIAPSMFKDGRDKVLSGITSPEEIRRIVSGQILTK